MQTLLDSKLKDSSFNGVIFIFQDNEVLYQTSKGNYGSPKKDSEFLIGSISKQITATIILNLVDEGLIGLHDPIVKYLSHLKFEGAKYVQIKHLLNHTAGIQSLDKPLEFMPGTKFKYSPTIAFNLAAEIAKKVSGKNFKQLVFEIFDKAGMKNSGLLVSSNMPKNQAIYQNLIDGFKDEHDIENY